MFEEIIYKFREITIKYTFELGTCLNMYKNVYMFNMYKIFPKHVTNMYKYKTVHV